MCTLYTPECHRLQDEPLYLPELRSRLRLQRARPMSIHVQNRQVWKNSHEFPCACVGIYFLLTCSSMRKPLHAFLHGTFTTVHELHPHQMTSLLIPKQRNTTYIRIGERLKEIRGTNFWMGGCLHQMITDLFSFPSLHFALHFVWICNRERGTHGTIPWNSLFLWELSLSKLSKLALQACCCRC